MLNQRKDWNIRCQEEEGWLGSSWICVLMGTQKIKKSFLVVQSKWASTYHIPGLVEAGLLDSEGGSAEAPHYEKGNGDQGSGKVKGWGRQRSQGCSVPWRNLKNPWYEAVMSVLRSQRWPDRVGSSPEGFRGGCSARWGRFGALYKRKDGVTADWYVFPRLGSSSCQCPFTHPL